MFKLKKSNDHNKNKEIQYVVHDPPPVEFLFIYPRGIMITVQTPIEEQSRGYLVFVAGYNFTAIAHPHLTIIALLMVDGEENEIKSQFCLGSNYSRDSFSGNRWKSECFYEWIKMSLE